jgi:HAD superfamily phosphoserine phosphatase-like hydrolase
MLEIVYAEENHPFETGRIFPGTRIRQATAAVHQRKHCLLKLHGDYEDASSRILTLSEYKREYGATFPEEVNESLQVPLVLGQALAAGPLLFLGCSLKKDRTLAVIRQLAARYPGIVHFALLSDAEAEESRLAQLNQWNIRPIFYPAGQYSAVEAFLEQLASFCENIDHVKTDDIRINGLKLFYFRRKARIGISSLAKRVGIRKDALQSLERVDFRIRPFSEVCFAVCSFSLFHRIESALDCKGKLHAGQDDDFRSDYMQFKQRYTKTQPIADRDDHQAEIAFTTKAVVFDFDGTLTLGNQETTWEKIWIALGYSINDCANLHFDFSSGKITHQQWCDLTMEKFVAKGFTRQTLDAVANEIRLMPGVKETFAFLESRGIKIYIVSGSIKSIIHRVMGNLRLMVEDIRANEMDFHRSGLLRFIRGTKYDFKGKATYLKELMRNSRLEPHEVLFVGNSCNDLDAIQSRARTLCVNPHAINADVKHWTHLIKSMRNMKEILAFVEADGTLAIPSGIHPDRR